MWLVVMKLCSQPGRAVRILISGERLEYELWRPGGVQKPENRTQTWKNTVQCNIVFFFMVFARTLRCAQNHINYYTKEHLDEWRSNVYSLRRGTKTLKKNNATFIYSLWFRRFWGFLWEPSTRFIKNTKISQHCSWFLWWNGKCGEPRIIENTWISRYFLWFLWWNGNGGNPESLKMHRFPNNFLDFCGGMGNVGTPESLKMH